MRHHKLLAAALLCLGATAGSAQQPPVSQRPTQAKPAVQPKAAPSQGAGQRTASAPAVDKAALEQYVRHLFVWGPQIEVKVQDPKPSTDLPGFQEVLVSARAGQASQEDTFYVSA